MHLPEHLLLMKSKVLQGIVPQAVLDDYVNIEALEQRKRPAAMAYASAFVDALERTSGAPRGDLWAKQKDAAPRVYLPGGFVSFSPQGEMSGDHMTPGLRRQRLSWSKDSLYPSQRKPYDKAVALYSVERRAIAEDMLEALQARISAIHDALDAAVSVEDDEDFDELDVRAERAAWQERHEEGRGNPRRRRNPSGPLVLFHGAHRWIGEPELRPAGKDKSNHGNGLYLTTSTDTARSYAKGGGQVLRFEVQPLVFADEVRIPLETLVAFVKSLPRLKNKQAIVDDLRRYAMRVGKDMMPAYVVENLMQNNDALKGAFGPALAAFFVEQGVDASLVTKGNEDWVVLYNLDKIESYRKATPAELLRDSPRVVR